MLLDLIHFPHGYPVHTSAHHCVTVHLGSLSRTPSHCIIPTSHCPLGKLGASSSIWWSVPDDHLREHLNESSTRDHHTDAPHGHITRMHHMDASHGCITTWMHLNEGVIWVVIIPWTLTATFVTRIHFNVHLWGGYYPTSFGVNQGHLVSFNIIWRQPRSFGVINKICYHIIWCHSTSFGVINIICYHIIWCHPRSFGVIQCTPVGGYKGICYGWGHNRGITTP